MTVVRFMIALRGLGAEVKGSAVEYTLTTPLVELEESKRETERDREGKREITNTKMTEARHSNREQSESWHLQQCATMHCPTA